MKWRYQLLRREDGDGDFDYSVHEVYVDDNGTVGGWTAEPVSFGGVSAEVVVASLASAIQDAVLLPVLTVEMGSDGVEQVVAEPESLWVVVDDRTTIDGDNLIHLPTAGESAALSAEGWTDSKNYEAVCGAWGEAGVYANDEYDLTRDDWCEVCKATITSVKSALDL